jgi:hypothetical protein
MKLNAIAAAVTLACLVTGSTLALATPNVAQAACKNVKSKTGKIHKVCTKTKVVTGGYG